MFLRLDVWVCVCMKDCYVYAILLFIRIDRVRFNRCGPQRCTPRLPRSRAPSVEAYDLASLKQILMCTYLYIYIYPTKITAVKSMAVKSRRHCP